MSKTIALIVTDLARTRLGLTSRVSAMLGDRTVLAHVVGRAARVKGVEAVVLVHPIDQHPLTLLEGQSFAVPVHAFADGGNLVDRFSAMREAARKWALPNWRGGLGGALCYDELLPAGALLAAMQAHGATSALLVGADWPLVDVDCCAKVLALNLEHPDAMRMTFTQAPPGLAGIALSRTLLEQMAGTAATFGQVIAYDPAKPQADPIGRDVCVQIPALVRNCVRRFIYDTPRTVAMIDALAQRMGDAALADADAMTVVESLDVAASNGLADAAMRDFGDLPQQVTLELNTQRLATGPLVVQHHVALDREPMSMSTAQHIVSQLGQAEDVALTLGGLGDALLHEQFAEIIVAARMAGVMGIAVEADLLCDEDTARRLLDLPIDVITVRLNADGPETYRKVMGVDRFHEVLQRIEMLLNERNRRSNTDANVAAGVPWIVPRMLKTADTLAEMESFFDRWMHFTRHAVIESPSDGCGAMMDIALVRMAPPRRYGCRQLMRRMTVHATGQAVQCDQDWQARAALGDATRIPLTQLWQSLTPLRQAHADGEWNASPLCEGCRQWHRP